MKPDFRERLAFGPSPRDDGAGSRLGPEGWLRAQLDTGGGDPAPGVPTGLERMAAAPPPPLLRALNRRLGVEVAMDPGAGRGPVVEAAERKLRRAVCAEGQLVEVLADFWFNHFNVFAGKATVGYWVEDYEYRAIRPHVLGRFRDLLHATAFHPAMLLYLDNALSSAPGTRISRGALERAYAREARRLGLRPFELAFRVLEAEGVDTKPLLRRFRRRGAREDGPPNPLLQGLNENYARELLELHTLGVDGGYTQRDVVEVARCFTGWTVLPLPFGQQAVYLDELHDRGVKHVLGRRLDDAGPDDARRVLDLLASHPSTARFVAFKLCRRFVDDAPPPGLVDRLAAVFRRHDGRLDKVVEALALSPEFREALARRSKVKTPLVFVAGALRATGAEVRSARAPLGMLRQMGQVPYGAAPPTGYDDTAAAWVSPGGMLDRMRFALALGSGRLPGVRVPDGETPLERMRRLASPGFQRH